MTDRIFRPLNLSVEFDGGNANDPGYVRPTWLIDREDFVTREEYDVSAASLSDSQHDADALWHRVSGNDPELVAFHLKVYGPTKGKRVVGKPKGGRYLTFPWEVNPTRNFEFDELRELTGGTAIVNEDVDLRNGYGVKEGRNLHDLPGRVKEDVTEEDFAALEAAARKRFPASR